MRLKADFEIVEIAEEHLAIPVGKMTALFHGVIALSEPAAFMLRQMKQHKTIDELCDLITAEYEVEKSTAEADVLKFTKEMIAIGLIEE